MTDPVMVPLVALEIVRSAISGPRTPAAGDTAACSFAATALVLSPSKVPLIVNFVPARTPVTEPEPAISARVLASAGSADNLVILYVSPLWAMLGIPNQPSAAPAIAIDRKSTRL